jgi:hypothetical protein
MKQKTLVTTCGRFILFFGYECCLVLDKITKRAEFAEVTDCIMISDNAPVSLYIYFFSVLILIVVWSRLVICCCLLFAYPSVSFLRVHFFVCICGAI